VDVRSIRVGNERLDPMATYTVTVNEGIAMLFPMMGITPGDPTVTTYLEYNVLHDFIASKKTLSYRPQGRVLDLSKKTPEAISANGKRRENDVMLPTRAELGQNYPNPFNPTTAIAFSLPTSSHVTLKVFSILGEEVATLVDGTLSAGQHVRTFDASRLASGLYLYQLKGDGYTEVRRMMLTK
jgi:hypothetical protein